MAHSTKIETVKRGNEVTRTTTKERRQLASCKGCRRAYSREITITITERWNAAAFCGRRSFVERYSPNASVEVACCDRPLAFRAVQGTTTEAPCDARCTEAKGHKCECSCGGANHGSGAIVVG